MTSGALIAGAIVLFVILLCVIVALCCCAFIRGGKASGYTRKRRIRIRLGSWSHGDEESEEYEVDNAGGGEDGGGDSGGGDGGGGGDGEDGGE